MSDGDYEIDNTIQFIIETVEMKLNQLSDENEQLKKELKRCRGYDYYVVTKIHEVGEFDGRYDGEKWNE